MSPRLLKVMCADLAKYALTTTKGADAMDVSELAARLEAVCENAIAMALHESLSE